MLLRLKQTIGSSGIDPLSSSFAQDPKCQSLVQRWQAPFLWKLQKYTLLCTCNSGLLWQQQQAQNIGIIVLLGFYRAFYAVVLGCKTRNSRHTQQIKFELFMKRVINLGKREWLRSGVSTILFLTEFNSGKRFKTLLQSKFWSFWRKKSIEIWKEI